MTLYTKADLRNQALRDLALIADEEDAPAEMQQYVDAKFQQLLEYLNDENCLIFDSSVSVSTQVIPGRIMSALGDLLECEIGPGYGKPQPEQRRMLAMNQLRRSVLQGMDPIPVEADFF